MCVPGRPSCCCCCRACETMRERERIRLYNIIYYHYLCANINMINWKSPIFCHHPVAFREEEKAPSLVYSLCIEYLARVFISVVNLTASSSIQFVLQIHNHRFPKLEIPRLLCASICIWWARAWYHLTTDPTRDANKIYPRNILILSPSRW